MTRPFGDWVVCGTAGGRPFERRFPDAEALRSWIARVAGTRAGAMPASDGPLVLGSDADGVRCTVHLVRGCGFGGGPGPVVFSDGGEEPGRMAPFFREFYDAAVASAAR